MKEQFDIPKYYVIIIFCILTVMVIIAAAILSKNYFKYKAAADALVGLEINGVIQSLKDEGRGSYFLEIKTEKELLKIHSLPVAWEVKNYNIQIGDSVSKKANSRVMIFYKLKDGTMKKACTFEI
jgi:hypothetical protein